jgi:hypothetical protein
VLDLAIAVDTDPKGIAIVETNHGVTLKAPDWPHDCDFQLVGFSRSGGVCEVVGASELVEDIGKALMAIDKMAELKGRPPDWYRRLKRYARGSSSARRTK